MDRVKGKVVIITGAASGLGRGAASLLAKEGAKVILTDINEAKGNEAAEEIQRNGGEAVFMKLDVSSESDWSKVIEKTLAELGKLDVLVNNAGVELDNLVLPNPVGLAAILANNQSQLGGKVPLASQAPETRDVPAFAHPVDAAAAALYEAGLRRKVALAAGTSDSFNLQDLPPISSIVIFEYQSARTSRFFTFYKNYNPVP